MPILNYTTKVSPEQTVAELTALLVRKGARSITSEYHGSGRVESVSFVMVVGGLPTRFVLPVNVDGVTKSLLRDKPWRNGNQGPRHKYEPKMRERAEWVAWRILKDWVAAQMALIESGQAEAAQVFLPYATEQSGRTLYELYVENNQKRLGNGETQKEVA